MLQQIVVELSEFARDGREYWQFKEGSSLPAIEALPRIRDDVSAGERSKAEIIADAIGDSFQSLDGNWREVAEKHLGYWAGAPRSLVAREERAAQSLNWSLRTYRGTRAEGRHRGRSHGGQLFDSWAEVTLTLVARTLIAECEGDLEAPPVGGDDGTSTRARRRLGDVVRDEIADLYRPVKPEDFNDSFFHRPSTQAYIDQLADLDAVTLYTGGAISAELHTPLSDRLMAQALKERLRPVATDLNGAQRQRVIDALMRAYPPAHLGSIAREFVRRHSKADPGDIEGLEREAQDVFAHELRDALEAGRDSGGFLALGLGALAFALKQAGRDPVRVLTTNYDDQIGEADERVHEYFKGLRGYSFSPCALGSANGDNANSVPLYNLNGRIGQGSARNPLIIGEADSLTHHYEARARLIERALTESACIFVGGDLTEPDLLAKLVTAPYPEGLPRYAVILAPELYLRSDKERAKALNLAAQRFLHLGVIPIIIDFPHQAPQFLIEVSLRLQQGRDAYRSYAKRLEAWWGSWRNDFGFGPGQAHGGERERRLQQEWMTELEKIRGVVAREHLEIPTRRDGQGEQIQIEVWIRHPDERSLVLWASSNGLWTNSRAAPRCYIHEGKDVPVQRAFREGTPIHAEVSHQRDPWRYQLSIPLVLRRHPWHHLPVGVVNVLSSEGPPVEDEEGVVTSEGGRLGALPTREAFAKDLAALTSSIKGPVNALLDPNSSFCRRKRLGKPVS